jgi:hypothetical protein
MSTPCRPGEHGSECGPVYVYLPNGTTIEIEEECRCGCTIVDWCMDEDDHE